MRKIYHFFRKGGRAAIAQGTLALDRGRAREREREKIGVPASPALVVVIIR